MTRQIAKVATTAMFISLVLVACGKNNGAVRASGQASAIPMGPNGLPYSLAAQQCMVGVYDKNHAHVYASHDDYISALQVCIQLP